MAGSAVEQAFWDRLGARDYRNMQKRHVPLWRFVHGFIEEHRIASVLEIGCGLLSPVPAWVPCYHGLDRNDRIDRVDVVHGDFLTLDLAAWRGLDLLLACGVIEHVADGYAPFLRKVRAVNARRSLVSFFNGLHWPETGGRRDERGFWRRSYSGRELQDWLRDNGFDFTLLTLSARDSVLMIQGE